MIIHVASYGVRFATRFQIVQMDQTNLLVHAQPQRDPALSRRTFVATMVTITDLNETIFPKTKYKIYNDLGILYFPSLLLKHKSIIDTI